MSSKGNLEEMPCILQLYLQEEIWVHMSYSFSVGMNVEDVPLWSSEPYCKMHAHLHTHTMIYIHLYTYIIVGFSSFDFTNFMHARTDIASYTLMSFTICKTPFSVAGFYNM